MLRANTEPRFFRNAAEQIFLGIQERLNERARTSNTREERGAAKLLY